MAITFTPVIPVQHSGIVTSTAVLSPKIIHIALRREQPLNYTAGQYASFLIENARRPLSYATPDDGGDLEFIVDIAPDGIASKYVAALAVGDVVQFLTPYGRFMVDHGDTRPLVFLATGSGIAPIRAQIQDELQHGTERPITLLFGNRDEAHMFLLDEFYALEKQYPNFTFIPVCSEPTNSWQGERGLVTEVVLRRVPDLLAHSAYICGGPAMVKDSLALLLSQGIPKEFLHTEQFI